MKKKNSQMSSSLAVGILLALAGGFMDAYSDLARGHVFANAQTGNILLFAVAISGAHSGGQGNAQGKADHRQQIPQALPWPPLCAPALAT